MKLEFALVVLTTSSNCIKPPSPGPRFDNSSQAPAGGIIRTRIHRQGLQLFEKSSGKRLPNHNPSLFVRPIHSMRIKRNAKLLTKRGDVARVERNAPVFATHRVLSRNELILVFFPERENISVAGQDLNALFQRLPYLTIELPQHEQPLVFQPC